MPEKNRKAITQRFSNAIEDLKSRKVIGGLATFCKLYNLNQGNLHVIVSEVREVKPYILAYLVNDFGVSAEWLLCGTGDMYQLPYEQRKQQIIAEAEQLIEQLQKL